MGTISNDLEIDWLDHVFENTAFTVPTNIYIALSTTLPAEDGTNVSEPGAGAYARKVMNTWNAAAARKVTNNGVITFATATAAWGNITHYAIYDAITAGNFLAYGSLAVAKDVVNGNTPCIADTEIEVSVTTGGFSDHLSHEMLDHTFKTGAYGQPTIYIGLTTTIPTDSSAGTEATGNNYARKAHAAWDAAAAGATQNTSVITFNTPSGTWGECVFATVHDAAAAGNYLARGDITDQTPDNGDTVRFNAGDLDVTLD